MDPATRIYSCDDHLDLSGGAARAVGVAAAARPGRARAARRRARRRSRSGCARTGCSAAAGPRDEPGARRSSARSGARASRTTASAPAIPSCGSQDMDRDNLWASVIYGPLAIGLPIRDPALQSACYAAWNDWAVEEFNAVAPDRLCVLALPARPLARGRRGRARALCADRPPRRDHRRLRDRPRRPGVGSAVVSRGADRPADQLPPQGRHVVEAAQTTQIGKWQSAAFATRPAPAARRAARDHDVLRRARAAPGLQAGARGVGRRLAAVLPDRARTWSGEPSATSSTTRPRSRRASSSAAR